ncbi:MAG: glycosyltransferase, partial [Planctomycetales bacterium]|nr:glycosyltransferase [Planctomycetales bacterium]
MNVVVTVEHRFRRTPDGRVWTQTQYPRSFWDRYLQVFDQVRVVARVADAAQVPSDWLPADGPGVQFHALPDYQGLGGYLKNALSVRAAVGSAVGPSDAVILRASSPIANWVVGPVRRQRRPFAVEVVSDPWDTFSPGAFRHPLRGYFRRLFSDALRRQCRQACAVAYVTRDALQRRYPPGERTYSTHYSSIDLPPDAFSPRPRSVDAGDGPLRLICVGAMSQLYKGHDVLIDAAAACLRRGV